ncbi:MAG: large repetitive protein [Thermoleophilales bacterium]|nr:large repetitive protein [Thermoleophilales bacterium]
MEDTPEQTAPSVTSIGPSSGPTGEYVAVTVTGELFDQEATLAFELPDGPSAGVIEVEVTNDGDESTMTAQALFEAAGEYDVTVRNPDGQESTMPGAFAAR